MTYVLVGALVLAAAAVVALAFLLVSTASKAREADGRALASGVQQLEAERMRDAAVVERDALVVQLKSAELSRANAVSAWQTCQVLLTDSLSKDGTEAVQRIRAAATDDAAYLELSRLMSRPLSELPDFARAMPDEAPAVGGDARAAGVQPPAVADGR